MTFSPFSCVFTLVVAMAFPATSAQPDMRTKALFHQFHCMVCSGQSLAESDAVLAVNMRAQITSLVAEGRSDADIVTYMRERYGDGILMQPPVKAATLPLWAAPSVSLVLGGIIAFFYLRKRKKAE